MKIGRIFFSKKAVCSAETNPAPWLLPRARLRKRKLKTPGFIKQFYGLWAVFLPIRQQDSAGGGDQK
jgi:hypothetical protein